LETEEVLNKYPIIKDQKWQFGLQASRVTMEHGKELIGRFQRAADPSVTFCPRVTLLPYRSSVMIFSFSNMDQGAEVFIDRAMQIG
jgi:hypothetical protein